VAILQRPAYSLFDFLNPENAAEASTSAELGAGGLDEEGNVIDIALPEDLANDERDEATEATGGEPVGVEPAGGDSTEERA